jgi:hypothetical protein
MILEVRKLFLYNENNHETSSRDISNYVPADNKKYCQLGYNINFKMCAL